MEGDQLRCKSFYDAVSNSRENLLKENLLLPQKSVQEDDGVEPPPSEGPEGTFSKEEPFTGPSREALSAREINQ